SGARGTPRPRPRARVTKRRSARRSCGDSDRRFVTRAKRRSARRSCGDSATMCANARARQGFQVLGQFLEFSIATRPLAPSAAYFTALGFRSAATADTLAHPYAAYFDSSVTFGLHDRDSASPALTFVRPDLKNYVRALRRLRIDFD